MLIRNKFLGFLITLFILGLVLVVSYGWLWIEEHINTWLKLLLMFPFFLISMILLGIILKLQNKYENLTKKDKARYQQEI